MRLQEALAAAVALGDSARLRADTAAASLAEAHRIAVTTAETVERRLAGMEADHARRLAMAGRLLEEAKRAGEAAEAECGVLRLALQQAAAEAAAETATVREAAAEQLERQRLFAATSTAAATDAADVAAGREAARAAHWQAVAASACAIALRATRDSQAASSALRRLLTACEELHHTGPAAAAAEESESGWSELDGDDAARLRSVLCSAAPALRGAGRRAQLLAANAALRRAVPPGEVSGAASVGDAMFLLRGRAALLGSPGEGGCRPLLSAPECGRHGLPDGGGASDDAPGENAAAELAAAALSGVCPEAQLLSLSDDCVVASLPRSAVMSLLYAGHGAVESATSRARMAARTSDALVSGADDGVVAELLARVGWAQALLSEARHAVLRDRAAVRQPSPEETASPEVRAQTVDSLLADLAALCPSLEFAEAGETRDEGGVL